jgi:hypothetical protein
MGMNARVPRVLVLTLVIAGGILALLSSPFLIAAAQNNLHGSRLAAHLASAPLPDGARVIDSTGRVFNGGNGNGCDYQGLAIVSYWGDVADLRQAYMKSLELYARRFPDPKIIEGATDDAVRWGAKVWGESTEFYMSPNSDHSGLYLVSLTNSARDESFDLRCW